MSHLLFKESCVFFRCFFFPFNQCRDLLTVQILRPQPVASLASRPFKGQCSQAAVLTLFTPHEGGCTYTCTHTCISLSTCVVIYTLVLTLYAHMIYSKHTHMCAHTTGRCVSHPLCMPVGVHTHAYPVCTCLDTCIRNLSLCAE